MAQYFSHERMDVYNVALAFAQWASRVRVPRYRTHLRDQLLRASDSMVLNIAEGAGHPAGNVRRHHFRIAKGSAAECGAILDLLQPPQMREKQDLLRRVSAMLYKLAEG